MKIDRVEIGQVNLGLVNMFLVNMGLVKMGWVKMGLVKMERVEIGGVKTVRTFKRPNKQCKAYWSQTEQVLRGPSKFFVQKLFFDQQEGLGSY